MIWAQANELVESAANHWILIAVLVGIVVALVVLLRIALTRKKPHVDLETGLREVLADYPSPPPVRRRRLTICDVPVRVRLVVMAPTGKLQAPITPDDVAGLLDGVHPGMGAYVAADKPRIRIWPPQLSVAGFTPTFHRLVESPDASQEASRWVKVAGPARTSKQPILLGLAVIAEEPVKLGDMQVETTEWRELLRIER
jgi:hypothetical protein